MAEKNICGKIPLELHEKVRQEVERDEITTSEFIRRVIEEHFTEKGEENMAKRTVAVQVSEEFFARMKAAIAWDGCKQKDFLIKAIDFAICEIEVQMQKAGITPVGTATIMEEMGIEPEEEEPVESEMEERQPEESEPEDMAPEDMASEDETPEESEMDDTEPEDMDPDGIEMAETEQEEETEEQE